MIIIIITRYLISEQMFELSHLFIYYIIFLCYLFFVRFTLLCIFDCYCFHFWRIYCKIKTMILVPEVCKVERNLFTKTFHRDLQCALFPNWPENPHKSHPAKLKNVLRLWEDKNFLLFQNQTEFVPFRLSLNPLLCSSLLVKYVYRETCLHEIYGCRNNSFVILRRNIFKIFKIIFIRVQ